MRDLHFVVARIALLFASILFSAAMVLANEILDLRADDPGIQTLGGNVVLLPDRAQGLDAAPVASLQGPALITDVVNGVVRPALNFNGTNQELQTGPITVPPNGSLFVVLNNIGNNNGRVVGWEDSTSSANGVGLGLSGDSLDAIARNHGVIGDVPGQTSVGLNYEILSMTWGPAGVTVDYTPYSGITTHIGSNTSITAVSSAPNVTALRVGGPGFGSQLFDGNLLELRAYDNQLTSVERIQVETQLFNTWFSTTGTGVYWTGTNGTNWADTGNWTGAVPGAATGTTNTDAAVFNQNAPNSPFAIDAGRSIRSVIFDTASVNSLTIGAIAGNALLLTAGGTIQTTSTVVNPQTVDCALVLEGNYAFTTGAASSSATLSFRGGITPAATSGTTTLTLNGSNTGANTISGVLADNGSGQLAVSTSGAGLWILSGANTHSGGTLINSGTLQIAGPTTISGGKIVSSAVGTGTLTLASGATLQDDGFPRTLANNLIINGNVTFASAGAGSITIGPTGLSIATTVVLNNNPTLTVTNSTAINSAISGPGQSLTKTGAGTLILGGNNSHSGGTTISSGTLNAAAAGALGTGPVNINSATVNVTAAGALNSGSTVTINAGGINSQLNLFGSQTVSSLTTSSTGTAAAVVAVPSGSTLVSTGALATTGKFNAPGFGRTEIDGAPTLNSNGAITVTNGNLRFNVASGTATIGTAVTATAGLRGTLELAGSVSALSSGTNRVNITTLASGHGLLVSGTHQQVGNIDGAGNVQVNAGSDLTANHIIQNALIIGGSAGSPALVTIAASDGNGNPLGESSTLALAGSLTPSAPFGDGVSSANLLDGPADGGLGSAARSLSGLPPSAGSSAVPEPSTLILFTAAFAGLFAYFSVHHAATPRRSGFRA